MSKTVLIAIAFLAMFAILLNFGLCQDTMRVIDNSVFPNPMRPPAVFEHDLHNEKAGLYECNDCHHIYENGKKSEYDSSEDHRCVDCHSVTGNGNTLPLRKAFHQSCKGCHLELRRGPFLCGECHRK